MHTHRYVYIQKYMYIHIHLCIHTGVYVLCTYYMYEIQNHSFFGINVESQSLRTHFPIYQPLLISFRLIYHSVKCCCFCQLKWAVWDKCLICHTVLLLLKAQDLWSVCFSSFALHVGFLSVSWKS